MNEREIFLSALDIEDLAARQAHVQSACAGDPALLARVESLLALNDSQSQFLETPAVAQLVVEAGEDSARTVLLGADSTQNGEPTPTEFASHGPPDMTTTLDDDNDDENPLGYLEPSEKPGSLGRLAHYEILNILGRGAFGIVLKAFDEKLQRVVAIKVLAPEMAATSPARKRFLREARASAAIRHENVVAIYAVEEKPLPYLVMEYIPGQTLQQRLDHTGPLAVADVLALGRQIAEGLAAAHAKDLIHRDIKPGNILLEEGVHERVKITDFGLARAADDASMTQSGLIAGTPMYMAPEQALGKKLDQRADLFSLGSVLYQMVSGRPPFRAASTLAVLKRVTEDTPRPITEVIPETPRWLCAVISKLHAKNPEGRYQSAAEVASLLSDYESKLKANSDLTKFDPASNRRQVFALRWTLVTTAVLLTAVGAFGLYDMLTSKSAPPEDTPALITPVEPVLTAASSPATVQVVPVSDTWVQLFNGNDLTGWKTHPDRPGDWKVKDGVLVGSNVASYLFSDADQFENFHLRVETKINRGGDSGIFFHSPFDMRPGRAANSLRPAGGYEVELHRSPGHQTPTGSVWNAENVGAPKLLSKAAVELPGGEDEWFVLEILAQGNHFITRVNGKQIAEGDDPERKFQTGHFTLQVMNPQTVVQFRKIEIKELPASSPPLAIAPFDAAQAAAHQEAWAKHLGVPVEYTNSIGMKFRLIPPGEFTMGTSPEDAAEIVKSVPDWANKWVMAETPAVKAQILEPFYLGTTEVTVGQFKRFVAAEDFKTHAETNGQGGEAYTGQGFEIRPEFTWRHPDLTQSDSYPVGQLCPEDANAFCRWLQTLDGRTYQLPDEKQWEYACRAGTMTPWSFGASDELAELYGLPGWNLMFTGREVAKFPANPFGLFDIHGNLEEMCRCKDVYINRGATSGMPPLLARSASRGYPINGLRSYLQQSFRVAVVGNLKPSGSAAKQEPLFATVKNTMPFTDADVQRIAALPAPEQVEEVRKELVRRNPGFDGKMETKIEDGVVTEFKVVTNHVTDIAPIRVFANLRVLNLIGTESENGQLADLTPLANMNLTNLTYLSVANTKVDDAAMFYFRNSKKLKGLWLNETQVTSAGMANFAGCQDLEALNLKYTKVDDAGLVHFKDCKNLTGFDLGGLNATDAGLANFKNCPGLNYLFLNGTQVTDVGLAQFKDCTTLTFLHLAGTQATDDALAYFKNCQDLTLVILENTKVTDAGLVHLKDCKKLSVLNLMSTSVTAKAIDELKKAFPKCRIEWNGGVIEPTAKAVAPFTDADAKRIAALPAVEQVEEVRKELVRLNPKFDGKITPTIDNGVVTELSFNSDQVMDIAPVRALTKLVDLDCRGTYPNKGKLADLSGLKGMALHHLDCSSTQIADLTPLTGMKLTNLQFNHNPVSSLAPLTGMPLRRLGFAETKVSDLSLLKGLKLEFLGAQVLPVTDLSPLAGMPLKYLDLYHTVGATDLSPLKGMPLETLNLQDVPVTDLSPLSDMLTLRTLNLEKTAASDLTPLRGLRLTELLLRDERVKDLSPLNGLPLTRLEIYGTSVTDLRPLQNMPLEILRLTPKNITEGLDVVREIKSLKTIGIDRPHTWPAAEFWERYDNGEFSAK